MATVDNSTQIIISTESGTGWSVDVTNANLDPLLTLKDFTVKFDSVVQNNADFTKTSQTIITYNGVALGSPTEVVIARDTPNDRVKCLTFGDRLQSAEYEAEFNRVHKLINENEISGADNVKVTPADTTPGTLEDKIAEGADVLISVLNPGANEQLQISVSSPTSEPYVDINSILVVPDAVGTDAIAIGGGVTADGTSSIVLGTNSFTDNADFDTNNCIVIGNGSSIDTTPTTGADSNDSIAIGTNVSITDATNAITIGTNSVCTSGNSVIIGTNSTCTNASQSVVIGSNASGGQAGGVAIGQESVGSGDVAIGRNAEALSTGAIAIGSDTSAAGRSVVIGQDATASNLANVVIGDGATSTTADAVVIGDGSSVVASSGNAIGRDSFSAGSGTAYGRSARANDTFSVALGRSAVADGTNSIVIGPNSLTDNADFATESCIVIGNAATIDPTPTTGSDSSNSIAIGTASSITDSIASFALGNGTSISDSDTSAALGQVVNISGSTSANNFALGSIISITGGSENVCVGNGITIANVIDTVNIGNASTTAANSSIAIGSDADADATSPNAIVLGVNADAQGANAGIAIGAPALVRNTETIAISSATANGLRSISIGASSVSDGSSSIVIGNTAFTDNADFATENCIAIGFGASIDPTPTTGAVSNNSIAIGTNAAVLDAANAVQIGTGTNSTASTLQFLGNTIATANGLPFVDIKDSGGAEAALNATNVDNTIAIGGDLTVADGINMLSIGANNQLDGQGNDQGDIDGVVQIGFNNTYNELFGLGALGDNIQIGFNNTHTQSATENIQIGNDITTNASTRSVVIGHTITLNNNCPDAVLIGQAPVVAIGSANPIAIGAAPSITGGSDNCVALGQQATCTSNSTIAIGMTTTAEGQNTVVIGANASTDDTVAGTNDSVVIGSGASIVPTSTLTNGAVVIGFNAAAADGGGQIALGNTAVTSAANAIQLGTGTNNTASTVQYLTQTLANADGIQAKTEAAAPTGTPPEGTFHLNTTFSGDNGILSIYSNGAWRTIITL